MMETVAVATGKGLQKFLTFLLDGKEYGIEIKYVIEIVGLQEITSVPDLPDYVRGIINLRGEIIPVMDVRERLKKPVIEYDDRTCIIVVNVDGLEIGLIVDRVSEVLKLNEDNIVLPQEINALSEESYISGIGKVGENITLLLDCTKLIKNADMQVLQSM